MCRKRITYEFIKESFEKEECNLITDKYVDSKTRLNYICSNGHEHSIRWNDWQQGQRCQVCAGQAKPTLNQVKDSFNREGYTLLSKEYINAKIKLDYICFNGHKRSTIWDNWKRGHKCPICEDISKSGSGHPNWQGGLSYEPYCVVWKDKEYKEDIKYRDGHKCLNPYCSKKNNKLHIHHIDYDKKNCCPSNLITICNSCNSKANVDRDWHQTWYQAIIKNRYYSRSI